MSRFRWFIDPLTGGISALNRARRPAGYGVVGQLPGPSPRMFDPEAALPLIPSRPTPINLEPSTPFLLPPTPFEIGQARRLEDFVRLRATGQPAAIVEPPPGMTGIRRARPNPDPQDVNFVNAVAPSPEPPPIRVWPLADNEPLTVWQSRAFEPRNVKLGLVDGGEIRYTPLTASEIKGIEDAIKADPGRAYLTVLTNYDNARTPADFGRVLEQSRVLRQNLDMEPQYQQALNSAMARASRRFGLPETEFEEIIAPILFRNSPDLPANVRARTNLTMDEVRASYTDSDNLRIQINKSMRGVKKSSDLDEFDTLKDGGIINRALVKGELSQSDAVYLSRQLSYNRVRLLKKEGILGDSVKNDVRANGGQRGIDLIPDMSELGEGRKATIYKTAIRTAETPDEVSQIYMMARSDLRSPAFLDEIDDIAGIRGNFLARVEGVEAPRFARPATSTIDEESIVKANRALTQDEAARSLNDPSRPAFPSDDILPEDTIARGFLTEDGKIVERLAKGQKWAKDADGKRISATLGGATRRNIDESLVTPPPSPNVAPGSGRMTGFPTEYSGPGSYVPRTIQNAQEADITIAVARDFETGGELLTAAAADGRVRFVRGINKSGKEAWIADPPYPYGVRSGQYGRVTELEQINHLSRNLDASVDSIVNKLNAVAAREGRPVVINGAGNGLGRITSQDEADAMARHIMNRIVNHPNRNFEIAEVISGGQNGYDIAFSKAAKAYGLNTKINPPYTSRGSIMLQKPGDVEGIIFMEPKQYVRHYRLDTAEVGESVAELVGRPITTQQQGWVGGQQKVKAFKAEQKFEVSSRGDKRFSAGWAEVDGRTIEDIYQVDIKGGVKTGPGRFDYSTKGKPAAPGSPASRMTPDEQYEAYKNIWIKHFDQNPDRLRVVAEKARGKVLTDIYGSGDVNQARAIHDILTERGLRQLTIPSPSMTMPMNFADGTRGLRMAPQHSGKSTMDLILEGNRTGTTRANLGQFKKPDGSTLQVGDVVEFTDRSGRKAVVEITKAPYQLPKSSDPAQMNWYAQTWSKYEGWDPSMYGDFVDQWQIQYRLLSS